MSPELSWRATKRRVYEQAKGCCEYCYTCDCNTGQAMHVEHIDPNGGDGFENLCLACSSCNFSKATVQFGTDPVTDQLAPLFNPRTQSWSDHFAWVDSGLRIHGLTSVGRATVSRLKMNQPRLIRARNNWILAGNHPPDL